MAIYHLSAKVHSRSTGASAVAAAAYRSGMELVDARTGEEHDYSRRTGVEGSEILAPEDSPDWVRDRSALWNAAEGAERRKDAQVAREVEVAAPVELSKEQRRELVQGFAEREFVARGMVADIAYHDGDGSNPPRSYPVDDPAVWRARGSEARSGTGTVKNCCRIGVKLGHERRMRLLNGRGAGSGSTTDP